jgi:hypothetical protein
MFAAFLVSSAWIFDYYHKSDEKVLDEIQRSASGKQPEAFLFCFTPSSYAGFKLQVPRPVPKKVFFESENKFLELHHSQRAYYFFKAEPLLSPRPLWLTQHQLLFSFYFSDNPDDIPATA